MQTVWRYCNPVAGKPLGHSAVTTAQRQEVFSLFRAHRYAADYAGLQGKHLTPGMRVEEQVLETHVDKAKH